MMKEQKAVYTENACKAEYDTLIFGQDPRCRLSMDCSKTGRNNNIVVAGNTGSGKTMSTVVPNLLHMEHSNVISVFTKLGLMTKIADDMKKRGYNVHILNLVEPAKSDYGFDPLRYCKTEEDVGDLAHAIIYSAPQCSESRSDPFWDNAAEKLLEVNLRTVKRKTKPGKDTMDTALRLLDRLYWVDKDDWEADPDDQEEIDEKWRLYPAHNILDIAAKEDDTEEAVWQSFARTCDKTGSSIAVSLQNPLRSVFPANVRKCLTNPRQFDFAALMEPKTALFVYISPVNVACHRFVSLFYRQAFKSLFELAEARPDRMLPYPVHVFFDDFATGSRIPDFDKYISIFREKRISVTILLQSESQLEGIYGKPQATTIINNCDTYIYLGGMDEMTCQQLALKMALPEDEILSMAIGKEFFIRRGQKPILTNRYDTPADPAYIEMIGNNAEVQAEASTPDSEGSLRKESLLDLFDIEVPKAKCSKSFCRGIEDERMSGFRRMKP